MTNEQLCAMRDRLLPALRGGLEELENLLADLEALEEDSTSLEFDFNVDRLHEVMMPLHKAQKVWEEILWNDGRERAL
jgi:hypothetical protein